MILYHGSSKAQARKKAFCSWLWLCTHGQKDHVQVAGKCVRLTMDPSPREGPLPFVDSWTYQGSSNNSQHNCLVLPVAVTGRNSYSLHGSGSLE